MLSNAPIALRSRFSARNTGARLFNLRRTVIRDKRFIAVITALISMLWQLWLLTLATIMVFAIEFR